MKNVLVLQHEFREHPSRLNLYALERGITLTVLRLWEPYQMPDPKRFDAAVILGGSMDVDEDFPSKNDEVEFIRAADRSGVPVLGICLGAQLIAHALGAAVYPMADTGGPKAEMGVRKVTLTAEGASSALFAGFEKRFPVVQLHGDTFDVPEGAKLLAEGEECRNQAFAYGARTFGVQFHLEYTPYTLSHLYEANKKWIDGPYPPAEEKLMDETFKADAAVKANFDRMMDNFLAV